ELSNSSKRKTSWSYIGPQSEGGQSVAADLHFVSIAQHADVSAERFHCLILRQPRADVVARRFGEPSRHRFREGLFEARRLVEPGGFGPSYHDRSDQDRLDELAQLCRRAHLGTLIGVGETGLIPEVGERPDTA